MRNLIIFLRRYFNFFLFLLLEVICLVLVFQNNDFQKTAYLNSANNISARLYERYNNVEYYFHLKATNDSLVKENARLHNMLRTSFDTVILDNIVKNDTIRQYGTDTIRKVVSTSVRRYLYKAAKVVNNSVTNPINYITIHRGSADGIRPNMGVVGPSGVVGIVRSVNDHYAVVLSLLSRGRNFGTSARLSKSKEMGMVRWHGGEAGYATMEDVPKSVHLVKGDTVVTSGYSAFFPENIPIGYVESTEEVDKASTSFNIRIRLATNFYNLQYVYVIDNLLQDEQKSLEDSTYKLIKQ
ncbi:rod shape-determining protein MreC [Chitinophaga sancti]|uniref:Cell shape-determining protein MreC n=1 Tax=Chitinophaga sancti TaxID=1004 RepID=A0A1K1SF60_9BACT|nr:rod shape-determining protein MreC [Chitinophaga sancti]WQD59967.1 rod shape-determining protein MreC [Chitinophaga sancti]WQG87903.1 rod shape-determining protein MreC [Chitinophaga sancti]SFW82549.1 rod shape-determining protein MreC [Chitinophaga sancti]